MNKRYGFAPALLAIAMTGTITAAMPAPAFAAEELGKNARALLGAQQESVVKLEATVESKMDLSPLGAAAAGQAPPPTTSTVEASGSVLNDSGLIVASLSSLQSAQQVMAQARGPDGNTVNLEFIYTIGEVRIRYADGKKVPGKLILKDPELDLAFIKPDTAVKPRQFLGQAGTAQAEVFDQLITLGRGGKATSYEPELGLVRISGVPQKPTPRYLAGAQPGTPAFSLDGKLVGIGVIRVGPKEGSVGSPPVILPIGEVLAVAKQVK